MEPGDPHRRLVARCGHDDCGGAAGVEIQPWPIGGDTFGAYTCPVCGQFQAFSEEKEVRGVVVVEDEQPG